MPRPAGIILAILLAAGCVPRVHADAVSLFAIPGTAVSLCFDITGMPILGCTPTTVTGALAVDVFTGTALAEAVLFFVAPGAVGAFAGTPPLEEVPTPD